MIELGIDKGCWQAGECLSPAVFDVGMLASGPWTWLYNRGRLYIGVTCKQYKCCMSIEERLHQLLRGVMVCNVEMLSSGCIREMRKRPRAGLRCKNSGVE